MADPDEGEICPFMLIMDVPALKYHVDLNCFSEPGLTQEAYEESVKDRIGAGDIIDEIIRIKCCSDESSQIVEIRRSHLMQSPTLANLIRSSDFLEGTDMIFTFLDDMAACFVILKEYLGDPVGYDCTRLRAHMFVRHKVCADKFMVQSNLYLLAKKLALPGLLDIVYECLISLERLMSPSVTITVTQFIFSHKSKFDRPMKDWCMKHVSVNFAVLHMSREWRTIVPRLGLDFRAEWAQLVHANVSILTAITERHDEDALEDMIVQMDHSQLGSVVSAIEHLPHEMNFEEVIDQVQREQKNESDDENDEDVELQPLIQDKEADDTKAKVNPGLFKVSRRSRPWSKSPTPLPEMKSSKARELMGITQDAENKSKKAANGYSKRLPRFLH
ncbi:hypothetical protein MMC07_001231 [Pseudocyphellaria aurata]|nr:hypothetical protein [Pseudocyphellaria aurata]